MEVPVVPYTFEVGDQTFERMQRLARPFVDKPEDVIQRLLDHYECSAGDRADTAPRVAPTTEVPAPRPFNPAGPPLLTHTKVLSAQFSGKALDRQRATWNGILDAAIGEATTRLKNPERVRQLIIVNSTTGRKEDEGYRFLSDLGISVQGQDANGAWRAAHHIATQLGCSFDVMFTWRHKDGAAHPGVTGRFTSGAR